MENTEKNKECVVEGISYISQILSQIEEHIDNNTYQYYNLPRFIYRGISKYYPAIDKCECDSQKEEHVKEVKEVVEKKVEEEVIKVVENGYIASGLSIRLYKTAKEYTLKKAYLRANYINVLEDMLRNVRKHYPEKYTIDMTDLDVLADIQHNGGATCLVDFSKNVLTSLWFACNEEPNEDGFLYCYDIMNDMIKNDALTYVRPEDEKKSISKLLVQTYKETNVSSDVEARFCLWEPSNRNNRILRQDSIFIFGIEKFSVKAHEIKVLRIPASQKQCILLALKTLFNISSNTIYNDHVGFATNNNKLICVQKMNDTSYNRGYINMLRGDYSSALDFFKLWEGIMDKKLSEEQELELHFSLAVCYKNINRQNGNIHYYENAINEYREVIGIVRNILKKEQSNEKKVYYRKKCTRAFSAIMDLEFLTSKYMRAITTCDNIIHEIKNGILKSGDLTQGEILERKNRTLRPKYCKIEKLELLDLEFLVFYEKYKGKKEKIQKMMDNFYQDAKNEKPNYFDNLLIEYYKIIFDIIISDSEINVLTIDCKRRMITWRNKISEDNNLDKYEGYILWNFRDIKLVIDQIKTDDLLDKKMVLQDITSYAISFRDIYEMQSWGSNDEI